MNDYIDLAEAVEATIRILNNFKPLMRAISGVLIEGSILGPELQQNERFLGLLGALESLEAAHDKLIFVRKP